MVERRLIAVEGVVQSVGLRPYVHRLAALDAFCRARALAPPPLLPADVAARALEEEEKQPCA